MEKIDIFDVTITLFCVCVYKRCYIKMPAISRRKRSNLENLMKANSPVPVNCTTEGTAVSGLSSTSSSFSNAPLLETGYDKNKSTLQLYNSLEQVVAHDRKSNVEGSIDTDKDGRQSRRPARKKMRTNQSLDASYENTSFVHLQKLWEKLRRTGSQMYTIEVH